MKLLEQLAPLERALASKDFPAMSPFWRDTVTKFYESGKRQLVLRVGRRGGKSTSLCRVAVLEALFGEHRIPPGDVGTVAIISTTRGEAAGRLRTIEAILNAIRVKHRRSGDVIDLEDRPVQFKVFTGSISGVSGFTAICLIGDEVAKWRDNDSGANPAEEVLASAYPTMATQPNAKVFLISSPFGKEDAHYEAFERGDTPFQMVAFAPSWVANPTITEEKCRALSRDEKYFLREYAAIPQHGLTSAFDSAHLEKAFRDPGPMVPLAGATMFTDSSAGRSDSWTWCFATWMRPSIDEGDGFLYLDAYNADGTISARRATVARDADGNRIPDPAGKRTSQPVLYVHGLGSLDGKFAAEIDSDQVVDHLATIARKSGAEKVHGDAYQSYFLSTAFAKRKLAYVIQQWSNETKLQAVSRLRQWLRDGTLIVERGPQADQLRKELLAFQEKITPSGFISFGARQGGHDDRVALLLNMAMADVDGSLKGSPIKKNRSRLEQTGGGWI